MKPIAHLASSIFAALLLAAPLAAQEFDVITTNDDPQVKTGQLELRNPSTPLGVKVESEQAAAIIAATGTIAAGANPFRYGTHKILDERVYHGGDADYSPLLWAAYVHPPSGAGNVVVAVINAGGKAVRFFDDGSIETMGLRDANGLRILLEGNTVFIGGPLAVGSGISANGPIAGVALTGSTVTGGTVNATRLAVSGSASVGGNLALSGTLTSGAVPFERLINVPPGSGAGSGGAYYITGTTFPVGQPNGTFVYLTGTGTTVNSGSLWIKSGTIWRGVDLSGSKPAN